MKKILGLSSLALAGVLAFTGCSKDAKDIEKIEKVEEGETFDKYKITYDDGSSDTFEMEKGIVSEKLTNEQIEEKYREAVNKSTHADEFSITRGTSNLHLSEVYMTINNTGLYSFASGSGISDAIVYDEEQEKFIMYKNNDGEKTKEYINGGIASSNVKEFFWRNSAQHIHPTIASFKHTHEDYVFNITYKQEGEKFVIDISGASKDGLKEYTYQCTFSDKIEKVIVDLTIYKMNGDEKEKDYDLSYYCEDYFTYEFNSSIAETDFSDYQEVQ